MKKSILSVLLVLVMLLALAAPMTLSAAAVELPARPAAPTSTSKAYIAFTTPSELAGIPHVKNFGDASWSLENGGTIIVTQKALYSFKNSDESNTVDGTRGTVLVTAKDGDTNYINIETDTKETGIILGNNNFQEANWDKVDYLRLAGDVILDDVVLFNRAHKNNGETMDEPNHVRALAGSKVVIGSGVQFAHRQGNVNGVDLDLPNMALDTEAGSVVFIDALGFSKYTGSGILVINKDLVGQVTAETFEFFDGAVVDESGKLLFGKEPAPAEETKPAETEAPETKAPETKAPETKAPETKAPETKAPETKAATGTEATGTKPAEQPADNGGVPAYVWVIVGVVAVAAIACAAILTSKKKKK